MTTARNDLQDLYSLAFDRIMDTEKAALSSAVSLHSCLIDLYAQAFSDLFDTTAQALAFCIELQRTWLGQMPPLSPIAAGSTNHFISQTQPVADLLAHGMDIALGERFTAQASAESIEAVASNSGVQLQPVPQRKTQLAMAAHAGG